MNILNRLSFRMTAAFILVGLLGILLVAALTYNSTTDDFSQFINTMRGMGYMGGGMMNNFVTSAIENFYDQLVRTLWIAGIAGVILAVILGIVFTRQISDPLGRLSRAAENIEKGNLDQRVDAGGTAELGKLGESFNSMAARLKYDQELRHNMIADISHELRTPLSIVQGNVEAMLDGVLPADSKNLSALHQETLLLSRLVEDLRMLSLAESGRLKFNPEDVDLAHVAENMVNGFEQRFAAKNIGLAFDAPPGLPHVWADPGRVAQVMRNLLDNAYKYTPGGGKVSVKVGASTGFVTVSITDTGEGIFAADLNHIFDRFYRVDRSRNRQTGGSGLGLAIVKQLVECQGGSVWAESSPGGGSTFSFKLPAA